jgi:hypothetical protein
MACARSIFIRAFRFPLRAWDGVEQKRTSGDGTGSRLWFQVMRRTQASLMRSMKEDPHAVAAQLGHTVDVSFNVYAQSPVEGRREMVNRVEKLVIK